MKRTFYKLMVAALVLVTINTKTQAQAPGIQWQYTFGGTLGDVPLSCQQTADGGYIVGGYTNSNNYDVMLSHGGRDCWVVKLDATGTATWKKTLGGPGNDGIQSIQQTSDGGYIVAGYNTQSGGDVMVNYGSSDAWVVKLTSTGTISWRASLGGPDADEAYSIRQTFDGGYIVAGNSYSNVIDVHGNHGASDAWIVKLTSTGIIAWQKCFGGTASDYARDIMQTADSGYFFTGLTYSSNGDVTLNHGYIDIWAVRIDDTGGIVWQKTIGGTDDDEGYSCTQATDGGFLITGMSVSTDGDITANKGVEDVVVVKLSPSGSMEWVKNYGGSSNDEGYSIIATANGGCIVSGFTTSNDSDVSGNHGSADAWILKLSATGSIQWQKAYGGTSSDVGHGICKTADHGYFFVADSYSNNGDLAYNKGNEDYWTVKLDSCAPVSPVITVAGMTLGTTTAYDSYQWMLGGVPIAGATSATYTATTSGDYTVEVTNTAGCSGISAAQPIVTLGIRNIQNSNLTVYPNPAVGGQFKLQLATGIKEPMQVVITNIVGEKVKELETTTNGVVTINLYVPGGVYFISATTEHGRYITKVTVQ